MMVKKLLFLIPLLAIMVVAGYFAEPYVFRPPEALMTPVETVEQPKSEMLFKMPLGKFTVQVPRNKQTLHMRFDIDVYLQGAANFERMNGAMGRAQLRDATVREIAEMAHTAVWMNDDNIKDLDRRFLAEQIVRRLHRSFPMLKTARVNEFAANVSVKN